MHDNFPLPGRCKLLLLQAQALTARPSVGWAKPGLQPAPFQGASGAGVTCVGKMIPDFRDSSPPVALLLSTRLIVLPLSG